MKPWLRKLAYDQIRRMVDWRDKNARANTTFPTNYGHNFLYEPLFPGDDDSGYFTKFFAEDVENPVVIDYKRFKAEIVHGKRYAAGQWHEFDCPVASVFPYAVTGGDFFAHRGDYAIDFRCNGDEYKFGNLVTERFHYLPVREPGRVAFRSDHDLIIGAPLPLEQSNRHKRRLVLVLFLDNLGWEIMQEVPFGEAMPNLAAFFEKGLVFDNFYVNSNWTLPSVSTLFSGKSLARHKMFHPRRDLVLGDGYPVLSELFQRDGYLTFQACGNWRKSPRYGYAKGFDRTIYRAQIGLPDILDSYQAHMEAFPERDSFSWLSIFDLHHPMAFVPDISVQTATPLKGHDYRVEHEKSPLQLNKSDGRTARYLAEMTRVDKRLTPLLRWIEENYAEEDFLVAAVSDHGTTFVTDDTRPLAKERCHAAFMVRGGGIAAGRSDEFVQSMDVMPTLLSLADIDFDNDTEGRVPEVLGGPAARPHVYSEIMYPGGPYTAVVRDRDFIFLLETKAPVDEDGHIDLTGAKTLLFRSDSEGVDIAADHGELCETYARIVEDHVAGRD